MSISMKQARIGIEKTQSEMAEMLSVNVNTYAKWEKDASSMPLDKFKKFCDLTHHEITEIFYA